MLFRLKCDAFSELKMIVNSKKPKVSKVVIVNGIKIRIVKHTITGKSYYYATNLWKASINSIETLYWKRWRVEEFYKTLKSYTNAKKWHTNRGQLIKQEIYVRSIVCVLASHIMKKTSRKGMQSLLVKCIGSIIKLLKMEKSEKVLKFIHLFVHKPYEKGRSYERF